MAEAEVATHDPGQVLAVDEFRPSWRASSRSTREPLSSALIAGLDRDLAFYPIVRIIIASFYALFAVMGASSDALVVESPVAALFLAAAGYLARRLWRRRVLAVA
ncbi:MAG: hypothetical protein K8H90_04710 [Thermoanaerobaculia bacterium]|nr:hypothetical protein [Thermoanaerobaculia bacterium]